MNRYEETYQHKQANFYSLFFASSKTFFLCSLREERKNTKFAESLWFSCFQNILWHLLSKVRRRKKKKVKWGERKKLRRVGQREWNIMQKGKTSRLSFISHFRSRQLTLNSWPFHLIFTLFLFFCFSPVHGEQISLVELTIVCERFALAFWLSSSLMNKQCWSFACCGKICFYLFVN